MSNLHRWQNKIMTEEKHFKYSSSFLLCLIFQSSCIWSPISGMIMGKTRSSSPSTRLWRQFYVTLSSNPNSVGRNFAVGEKREFAISRKTARWLLPFTFICTAKEAFLNIVVFIRVPPCLVSIYGRYAISNSALSRINICRFTLLKILIRGYQNPHFSLNFKLIPFPYPRVPLFLGPRLVKTANSKTANSEGRL